MLYNDPTTLSLKHTLKIYTRIFFRVSEKKKGLPFSYSQGPYSRTSTEKWTVTGC